MPSRRWIWDLRQASFSQLRGHLCYQTQQSLRNRLGESRLSAGRIIADGVSVDRQLRRQTIDGLIERVTSDHPAVVECVALLADLAVTPDVLARLQAMVEDDRHTLWARAVVADALADLGTPGVEALRALVRKHHRRESDAIWWATQRLEARVGTIDTHESKRVRPGSRARSLGEIGRQFCIQAATDQQQPPHVRADAASILYAADDPVGGNVLRELLEGKAANASLRLQMAQMLAARHDDHGVAALRDLALGRDLARRQATEIRRTAANALMSQGDPAGMEALRQLANSAVVPRYERREIAAMLVERHDPTGRELLARLDGEQALWSSAVQLAGVMLVLEPILLISGETLFAGRTTALLGVAAIGLFATLQLRERVYPLIRQWIGSRPRPPRHPIRRTRKEDSLEWLAASVHLQLVTERQVEGSRFDVYMRPRIGSDKQGARLLPVDIARGLARQPHDSFVIVGPPGSGKTQAATALALSIVDQRKAGDVVPVLLSLRSWSGSDRPLEDWIIDRLSDLYAIPDDEVARLVGQSRILPILDGLDEISAHQQGMAHSVINAMLRGLGSFVVTCRTRDYDQFATWMDALSSSTVVEMQPLEAGDVVRYIAANISDDQRKAWAPVIRELEQGAVGQFKDVMASPLSARMVLRPYLMTRGNPSQLLRQIYARGSMGVDLNKTITLEDYLSASLSRIAPYSLTASRRWLQSIAGQMNAQGVNEFRWWNAEGMNLWRGISLPSVNAILAPPMLAIGAMFLLSQSRLPAILASLVVTLGLLILSVKKSSSVPRGRTPRASFTRARAISALQTGALTAGAALLTYTGTTRLADATIVAVAAVGLYWTTDPGRFILSLGSLRLPVSLMRFLEATERAGVTAHRGPVVLMHDTTRQLLTRQPGGSVVTEK
jgi:hypothetical protein